MQGLSVADRCNLCGRTIPKEKQAYVQGERVLCELCYSAKTAARASRAAAPTSPPSFDETPVPAYAVLKVAAYVMMILGSLVGAGYVAFGVFLAVGGLTSHAGNNPMERALATYLMVSGLTAGLLMIVVGLVTALFAVAAGQLLLAVRDMAINSFHIRHAVAR